MKIDFDKAVEIADGVYWVGNRSFQALERNIYLRTFKGEGSASQINMVIDPGPPEDLSIFIDKTTSIIGDIKNIHIVFINHQDPDVGMNSAYLQKVKPSLVIMATDDTWRLVRYFGLSGEHFRSVNSLIDHHAVLPTGHDVIFVPTPFCHFRGACMVYDPQSRVLFSGDFFGGTGSSENLYANEASWDGIQIFHQIYMPTKEAMQHAIDEIRRLDPPPLMIAPQHGSILKGDIMESFIDKLYNLPVGLDLYREERTKELYIDIMNQALAEMKSNLSEEKFAELLSELSSDSSFPDLIKLKKDTVISIPAAARSSFRLFMALIMDLVDKDIMNILEVSVTRALLDNNLPMVEFHSISSFKDKQLISNSK